MNEKDNTELATKARAQLLAGRGPREGLIAIGRSNAAKTMEAMSQAEVELFAQLRCDTQGLHEFAWFKIDGDAGPFEVYICKNCNFRLESEE